MAPTPTLEQRIQALPQELQDNILDFTLLDPPSVVRIKAWYQKPPWQLSVNRRTRALVARHYYSFSTFQLGYGYRWERPITRAWLKSLSEQYRRVITIRLDWSWVESTRRMLAQKGQQGLLNYYEGLMDGVMSDFGATHVGRIEPEQMHLQVVAGDLSEERWATLKEIENILK